MTKIRKISLIGAGNLATNLGRELYNSGIEISSVYSRNKANADALASFIRSKGVNRIEDLPANSDLYILAVSDAAIQQLASELNQCYGDKLQVVHTSGTISIKLLEEYFQHCGVLYFLQSFTKSRKADFIDVPCFISANTEKMKRELTGLAEKIVRETKFINDENRKILHLAAVFCNNFVNNLYSVSKKIMTDENLPFEHLFPLIKETANRITEGNDPELCQTGPAKRNETKVIREHLKYLEEYPKVRTIYEAITKNINPEAGRLTP